MANISDLRATVKIYAQQCPDVTIDKYLVEALRDFCRRSWYHQEVLTISTVADQAVYTLTPTTGFEVIGVDSVKVDGFPYTPIKQHDIDFYPDDRFTTGWVYEPVNQLTIYSTPTESITDGMKVRVILQPIEGGTTLPDAIYRNYKEAIAAGALTYILRLPSESWTNPEIANQKDVEFNVGVYDAKGKRARGFVSANLRIRPRRFAI